MEALVEQGPLAGEGIVQASLGEPRCLRQASQGCGVIAVAPELLHGAIDHSMWTAGFTY